MSLTGAAHWTQQFNKTDGTPYSGVRAYHYEPGGTVDRTAYTDEAATSTASQPVTGDTKGRVSFYGKGNYRILVKSSVADGDVTLYDFDPVKLEDQPSGLRGELKATSYPAATSANRGLMFYKTNVGGDITEVGVNKDGSGFSALQFQSDPITSTQSWGKGADLASASTLTLGTDGNSFDVTGVVTIQAISSKAAGTIIVLQFDGELILTHNGTSLILKDAVNYKTRAGDVFWFLSLGSGNWQEIGRNTTRRSIASNRGVNGFRLTLTSGLPVTTSDVTAAGTLFCTPYTSNAIALYNGTQWNVLNQAEFSLALTLTSGKPYDVFCYDSSGTATLEVLVWTNDTTRATGLSYQDGVLVKSGDATRRYLGTLYASGANTTEDSVAKRYLWNYYNRVTREMRAVDATNSWNYTTATWRQANAAAANQLDFVIGVAEDAVEATAIGVASNGSAGTNISTGIGQDSTSANSAQLYSAGHTAVTNIRVHLMARLDSVLSAGRHFLAWLEYSEAAGTTTWYGDNGGGTLPCQAGIMGKIRA